MDYVFNHRAVACVKMKKHLSFKYQHIILSLVTITTLSACASKPRHVKANLPLVTPESSNVEMMSQVPERFWTELNKPGVVSLEHPNYQVVLKPTYVSALGLQCREIYIDSISKIACSIKSTDSNEVNRWYWVNELVKDKLEKKL